MLRVFPSDGGLLLATPGVFQQRWVPYGGVGGFPAMADSWLRRVFPSEAARLLECCC
jgi:hypothetical protein